MNDNLNPQHEKAKKILKIAGAIALCIGLIFAVIGFVDFFKSASSSEKPKLFFFLFIGLPLMAFGGMMLSFGFHRELMRYTKNESVPVINEAGKEITPAVKDIAAAVKNASEEKKTVKCPFCNAETDADGKFCSSCGKQIADVICPSCGEKNPADGNFCKNCGEKLK